MNLKQRFGNPYDIKMTLNRKYQDYRRSNGLYANVNLISTEEREHIDRYGRKTTRGYYYVNDIEGAKLLLDILKESTI
jgi:hypothetical protein